MNPVPLEIKERILTTAISETDNTASLDLALSVAENFGLKKQDAKAIASEVGKAVVKWRPVAAEAGITKGQLDRMASAFEHVDLAQALRG